MKLGTTLKWIRINRRLTMDSVYQGTGFTPSQISKWEHDRVAIGMANLLRLADFYQVTMDYVVQEATRGRKSR